MSYYGAGDYYRVGDYYGRGGILSSIGNVVKKIGGAALGVGASLIPGGSAALGLARGLVASPPPQQRPLINLPGLGAPGAGIGAFGTPAHMATYNDPRFYTKDGRPRRIRKDGRPWKRPTMDPGNSRAMRRAVRRSERFVGLARAALSNTKWKVASRSSSSRRGKK